MPVGTRQKDYYFIEEVGSGRSLNADWGDQVNPLPFYTVVKVSRLPSTVQTFSIIYLIIILFSIGYLLTRISIWKHVFCAFWYSSFCIGNVQVISLKALLFNFTINYLRSLLLTFKSLKGCVTYILSRHFKTELKITQGKYVLSSLFLYFNYLTRQTLLCH